MKCNEQTEAIALSDSSDSYAYTKNTEVITMMVKVGSTVKAAVQMENDLRDEGMGVILCANRGDTLMVHSIRNNGTLVVSRENHDYQFGCALDEVCDA